MKKVFGVIFLIIGLFFLVVGVQFLSSVSQRQHSFDGQVGETVSYEYRTHNDERQIAGAVSLGGGVLFIVLGIVMVASKSNAQRKKEAELNVMKRMQPQNSSTNKYDEDKTVTLSNKVKELYSRKDYHSAITTLKQLLEITPDDSRRFIDLACLYSLTENLESYKALQKAIELGYNNFEKIRTDSNLEWLRRQSDYEKFVADGYKIIEEIKETQNKKEGNVINDEVIEKLQKLSKLKEQGILTEDEFNEQKRRILQ